MSESESAPATRAVDPLDDFFLQERVQTLLDDWREKRISGEELSAALDRLSDSELGEAVRAFWAQQLK